MENKPKIKLYIIDSFSGKPFSGNPAAVCLEPNTKGLRPECRQTIAEEMNLSETVFIRILSDKDTYENATSFGLKWLTPTVEVKLCGHGTLAAAATLFYCVGNKSPMIKFETLSGTLTAKREGSKITLDFPLDTPVYITDKTKYAELLKLVAPPGMIEEVVYGPHIGILMVRIKQELTRKELEDLSVPVSNFTQAYPGDDIKVLILTMKGSQQAGFTDDSGTVYDYVARVFAPWVGVNEDPVTGSVQTLLGAYWSTALGKSDLFGRQCSKRGGEFFLHVRKPDGRINISGEAAVVLDGHITYDP